MLEPFNRTNHVHPPLIIVYLLNAMQVGYHGRDVDSIIKDLMDASLQLVKELKTEQFRDEVRAFMHIIIRNGADD